MDINKSTSPESIDPEKLSAVVRKNLIWIILIFIATNLTAYLTTRWTKDLFESESELKLDIKRDASELGIKTMIDDQNLNIVSGEIEQIKSKLFFSKLIDSLDLSISLFCNPPIVLWRTINAKEDRKSPTTAKISSRWRFLAEIIYLKKYFR